MADWTSEDAGYKLSMNVLKALGGDTSASYENTEEVWGAINDIYDIDNTFNVVPIEETVTSNKTLEYNITDEVDGYGPVKISIDVKGNGKTVIPNGFRFTGGDMSLIEWDKYDWSMVYDTSYFFQNCTFSDDGWVKRFESGFNGEIWSGKSMFSECSNLTSIPQLDTSKVTDMNSMFYYCSNLTSIPQLDTSKVTDMNSMFYYCSNLTSIPQLDTSKVRGMSSIFYRCESLPSIPQLDTSNATTMNYMFYYCSNLTSIPQLDTSKVTEMNSMFSECSNLTSIPQLDTSKVTTMANMFLRCGNLTSIPQLDTSKSTNMANMFYSCNKLTNIPQLDTSKVTSMANMFDACSKLTSIPLLDCSSVTTTTGPFGTNQLNNLTDLGGFKNLKSSWVSNFLDRAPNVTVESLMNVINNLYDFSGDGVIYTKQLKFGSTNLDKLTAEQKAVATNKGWTLTT